MREETFATSPSLPLVFYWHIPVLGISRTAVFIIFCVFVLGFNLLYEVLWKAFSFGHMLYLGTERICNHTFSEHVSQNLYWQSWQKGICAGTHRGYPWARSLSRTTGACFALINLAFDQVGYFLVLVAFSKYTGGEDRYVGIFQRWAFSTSGKNRLSLALLCSACSSHIIFLKFTTSPYGSSHISIKENEARVKFLGLQYFHYKWITFIISTSIAAFAGALSILNYGYVTLSFIDPSRAVEVIFAALIGGSGSLYGSIIPGVLFTWLSANYLASYISRWEMFLGIAFLFVYSVFAAVSGDTWPVN